MNEPQSFDDTYLGLRDQALNVGADVVNVAESGRVLGMVMDIGYPDAVATLVGLADGTTSLYFSNGGGAIGGGSHRAVAEATRRWVSIGEQLLARMASTTSVNFPSDAATQLVAITRDGWRTAEAPPAVFGSGEHPLSELFLAGHDVISQFRAVPESGLG